MPTSSAGLSFVPNRPIAKRSSHPGERSTTAAPMLCTSDGTAGIRPASSSVIASAAPTASTPARATAPRGPARGPAPARARGGAEVEVAIA